MKMITSLKKYMIGLVSFAVVLSSVVLSGCSSATEDYVMTIDGEKISRGEFTVYLMEQKKGFEQQGGEDIWDADFDGVSAEEVAKQNAANSLTVVKTAVKQSKVLGIEITKDDNTAIEPESTALFEGIKNELGAEKTSELKINSKLVQNIVSEGVLQQKVFDYVTEGYMVSESDFEKYALDYYNKNKGEYITLTVKEIYIPTDTSTDNAVKINEAYSKLQNGVSFDDVMNEYSEETKKESFELNDKAFSDETMDKLYSANVGDYVMSEEAYGYYIFEVDNVEKIPFEDVKEDVRADYIKEKKQEIYQTQNDKWTTDISVEKNDAVWNEIGIN